jgi:acyl-coenzyme A synthetase/AMP-(fatty) acid ligase
MNFYDDIARYGQATALITEHGEPITYAALLDAADRLRARLPGQGLAFLLAENCPESVIGYIGFLRSRTPVALLASALHTELLANLLETYRPHYVWLPRGRALQLPNATEVFALGNYVLLSIAAEPLVAHEDLALLLTTSGSTGSPKFVRQTHKNIVANATSIAQYLDIRGEDRPITTLPMHYVYGLSVINSHLLGGATIVLTGNSLMEKSFWNLLRAQKATSLAGVPYTYELLKRLRFERMDVPSLKVLTQAGGKLNATLVQDFATLCRKREVRLYVMYGAAEATARMSYLPPEYALDKPWSIGIAIPGGEFWIEDDNGDIIDQPGTAGELFYRGDNVALGYATCREDLALGDEWCGVLRTGDMARCDEQGFYCIVGRRSRFLKVLGNRVNLEEVEQHIRKRGVDCACAGEDDKLRIYVTDASKKGTVTTLVQELTRLHHSVYSVTVIDQLPRNDSGKIIYAALP